MKCLKSFDPYWPKRSRSYGGYNSQATESPNSDSVHHRSSIHSWLCEETVLTFRIRRLSTATLAKLFVQIAENVTLIHMSELPSYILDHMNESILGRAKLKLYKLVCGKTNWLPATSDVLRFIRKEFRKNPAAGKVFFTLLTENLLKRVKFTELPQAENAAQLLRRLEQKALSHQSVLEVSDCPEPLPKVLGVCIHRENLADGGYVYVVTLFDDESFPEAISGRMEVRACSTKPEPMFSVWSGSAYEHYSETNYHESWWADFAIKLLSHLDNNRPLTLVPISQIDQAEFSENNVYTPPKDKQLTAYIVDVLQSESSCTRATVPLETVKPFSLDFCLTYPRDIVEWDIYARTHPSY